MFFNPYITHYVSSGGFIFSIGQRVECKDAGEDWKPGVVTSVHPLQVRLDEWDEDSDDDGEGDEVSRYQQQTMHCHVPLIMARITHCSVTIENFKLNFKISIEALLVITLIMYRKISLFKKKVIIIITIHRCQLRSGCQYNRSTHTIKSCT